MQALSEDEEDEPDADVPVEVTRSFLDKQLAELRALISAQSQVSRKSDALVSSALICERKKKGRIFFEEALSDVHPTAAKLHFLSFSIRVA